MYKHSSIVVRRERPLPELQVWSLYRLMLIFKSAKSMYLSPPTSSLSQESSSIVPLSCNLSSAAKTLRLLPLLHPHMAQLVPYIDGNKPLVTPPRCSLSHAGRQSRRLPEDLDKQGRVFGAWKCRGIQARGPVLAPCGRGRTEILADSLGSSRENSGTNTHSSRPIWAENAPQVAR